MTSPAATIVARLETHGSDPYAPHGVAGIFAPDLLVTWDGLLSPVLAAELVMAGDVSEQHRAGLSSAYHQLGRRLHCRWCRLGLAAELAAARPSLTDSEPQRLAMQAWFTPESGARLVLLATRAARGLQELPLEHFRHTMPCVLGLLSGMVIMRARRHVTA